MKTLLKIITILFLFFLALYGINKNLPKLKNYLTPPRGIITPEKYAPELSPEPPYSVEGKG